MKTAVRIEEEACPRCHAGGLRCGESFWHHEFRLLRGTTRRYCPACGLKWHWRGENFYFHFEQPAGLKLTMTFAAALTALGLILSAQAAARPARRAGEFARRQYERVVDKPRRDAIRAAWDVVLPRKDGALRVDPPVGR